MSRLARDLAFALRMLRKSPGFAAVAILSLALGIGPNTAIFSLVDRLLLTDPGVGDPATLMDVYTLTPEGEYFYSHYGIVELARDGATEAFAGVAASAQYSGNLERDGVAELVLGELVTGDYFDVLQVTAGAGRTFLPEEDATPGTHPVVVLSDRYWRSRLGADPGSVGREVRLNGRPYTVVGIAPPSFRGRVAPGLGTDFWVPLSMYPHLAPGQMGNGNLLITARLRTGVTPAQARARLDAVATRFNESRPESRSRLTLAGVVVDDVLLHPQLDRVLLAMTALLFASVGLVLLVACVNLAGFLLARAADRRREMALRVALGASRGDLVRQLLVESMLLAALGGVAGLAVGMGALRLLAGIELPLDIPFQLETGLDGRVLAFTVAATLAATLLFGLTPALETLRSPVAGTLRDEAGTPGRGKRTVRATLVAGQMALSTVLLVGAGLFLRSLREATATDVGFDAGPAAVVTVEPWASGLSPEEQEGFAADLLDRVRALPEVRSAGLTTRLPLDLGVTNAGFTVPGVEPPPDRDAHILEMSYVSPGYLETMGIGVTEGRGIRGEDGPGGRPVVVVSRAAADRFWPGESAVGRVLYRASEPERDILVVGVAEDAKIWSLTEPPRPYLYFPAGSGGGFARYHLVARGPGSPGALADRIRETARVLNPDVLVSESGTMDDHLAYIYFLPRMGALLLALVGGLAVLMASVGLYGMVSYAVARRTREMGIRLALGAGGGRVVGLVVRGGLAVVLLGGMVGLLSAAFLGRLLEGFLIGVNGIDLVALAAAPAFLGAVAALAAWLPARRAARVDPVEALRSD